LVESKLGKVGMEKMHFFLSGKLREMSGIPREMSGKSQPQFFTEFSPKKYKNQMPGFLL